jgi:DNA-binding transcriptional LysR family regulator
VFREFCRGDYLATLLVAAYQREFPGARIDLQVANTATVLDRLRRFECDLALIESETSDPEFVAEPWLDDQLVVFGAPGHPMAQGGAAGNAQLATARWIVRERGSATRAQFDARVAAVLPKIDIGLELEHTEAIKRAVESGLGIGCLSRLALREALRRGSLVEVPTPQLDLGRRFYFAMHRQTDAGEAVARFRAICLRATQGATSSADLELPFIP